jgi:hypothetical protein
MRANEDQRRRLGEHAVTPIFPSEVPGTAAAIM